MDVLERGRSRTSAFPRPLRRADCVGGFRRQRDRGLASTALVLVAEWTALHEDELAANWERARQDEPLDPIDALA
jgi:hypothetical protein